VPNHVTNRITFAADKAPEVFAAVIRDGRFDFETLVPSPPHMYHGNLSARDEEDFPVNWRSWQSDNWGTKWNCYDTSHGIGADGKAFIQFDTAWSPPYPVMAAFCNRFNTPFEHRYFDEGSNFWGIDTWSADIPYEPNNTRVTRTEKRYKKPEDEEALSRELKPQWHEEESDSD
jgi:hypothetical protein